MSLSLTDLKILAYLKMNPDSGSAEIAEALQLQRNSVIGALNLMTSNGLTFVTHEGYPRRWSAGRKKKERVGSSSDRRPSPSASKSSSRRGDQMKKPASGEKKAVQPAVTATRKQSTIREERRDSQVRLPLQKKRGDQSVGPQKRRAPRVESLWTDDSEPELPRDWRPPEGRGSPLLESLPRQLRRLIRS